MKASAAAGKPLATAAGQSTRVRRRRWKPHVRKSVTASWHRAKSPANGVLAMYRAKHHAHTRKDGAAGCVYHVRGNGTCIHRKQRRPSSPSSPAPDVSVSMRYS